MKVDHEGDEDDLVSTERKDVSKGSKSWKALFTFTSRLHLLILVPSLFLSTVAGILQPAMAIFFGRFFDNFSDFGAGKINGQELMSKGLPDIHGLIAIGGATWLLKGGYFTTWLVFGELQAKGVRDELFQNLLQQDLGWFEARSSGVASLLSRLQTYVSFPFERGTFLHPHRQIRELQIGTSQPLGFTINYIVQAVASIGLSFYYSWKLTLVILAGIPVCAIVLAFISSGMQDSIEGQQAENQMGSTSANNAFTNIVAIKCFNSQELESRKYLISVQDAAKYYIELARSNAMQIGFVRFATTAMFVQGFYYGGRLVHSGDSTPGNVVTTFWSALMATKAFEDILPHIIVLEKGRGAAIALRAVLSRVGKGKKLSEGPGGFNPKFVDGDIEVRNISFAYPSRPTHLVLQESTFFFPAGETTFIVGKSGSGKSTLNNLLMRFYPPASGQIFIDGQALNQLSMAWLRNNITLVQQQSILFNETIFKNIAFGAQDHTRVTVDQVKPCVEMAALQNTISDLPNGLQTMVGSGGSSLSGGQKQRIAIARARLRDTGILILDESTSALDYISRTSVMEAIREWRKGKTTIMITHDMSQISPDDFVYVLEDGHIIQEGYRRDVSADMEKGLFQSDMQTPKIAPATHLDRSSISQISPHDDFDFGWGMSPRVSRMTTGTPVQHHFINKQHMYQESRESIDVPRERIPEDIFRPALRRKPAMRLSRTLSQRLSGGAIAVFEGLKQQSGFQPSYLSSPYHQSSIETGAETIRRMTTRAQRPMSMHQAMIMRSIYGTPTNRQKPLPTPQILENPKLLKRMSARYAKQRPPPALVASQPASIQKILATVWPHADHKNRVFLVVGILAALGHSAVPPAFSYILVQLFQTFYIPDGASKQALIFAMVILGIAVVDAVLCFSMHYLLEAASQAWVDRLRTEAMQRVLDQPKAWFDDDRNSPSNLTSSLDRNAEEMRNLVGRFAAFIVVVASMMTIALVWSFITCWKLTMVGLAAGPVLFAVTKGFDTVSSIWEGRTNTASDSVGSIFVETFTDIRTVRALTLESYFHRKYTQATSSAFTVGVRRAMYSGFFFGMSDSAIMFITALIFWFGAYLAQHKEYSVKSILTVFSLLLFSTANANAVIAYIPQISSSADTASRLLRLSQLPIRSHEHSGRIRLDPNDPQTLSGPINFVNLTFFYPTRPDEPTLDRLNVTIPAGTCTAIVGASGSGKSTIASLLLGMYPPTADVDARTPSDPSSGPPSLTLSGRDIRSLHLPTLRSLIVVVPQTPVIFPDTVRGNITYGLHLSSGLTTQYNVENAAKQAGIDDFIITLPKGYDTVIGEGGLGVSGGQAQRIVIARALIRKPRILILDEATSALDGQSAELVRNSVLALVEEERAKARKRGGGTKGVLTVIIITHSRDMMACAENVVVLEAGRVAEEGGFEELLKRRGKLFEMLRVGGVLAATQEDA
jgi:ATP-binding cassette subfamily B (MDR/TAP) protein 1